MKIKNIEWNHFIHHSDTTKILGKIANIKDNNNNVLVYYLILFPADNSESFALMASGNFISQDFFDLNDAMAHANEHLQQFVNNLLENN